MSRMLRICAFVFVALFASSLGFGEEASILEVMESDIYSTAETPELNISLEQEPVTLEQLEEMFGAKNVCGVPCGKVGMQACQISCGDNTARCFQGYCLYM